MSSSRRPALKVPHWSGIALAALAAASLAGGGAPQAAPASKSIVGTWRTRNLSGSGVITLYTFHADGNVTTSRTGAGAVTSGAGRWERRGGRVESTVQYLRLGETTAYAGYLETRTRWTVSRDGRSSAIEVHTDYFDAADQFEREVLGSSEAFRLRVIPFDSGHG